MSHSHWSYDGGEEDTNTTGTHTQRLTHGFMVEPRQNGDRLSHWAVYQLFRDRSCFSFVAAARRRFMVRGTYHGSEDPAGIVLSTLEGL